MSQFGFGSQIGSQRDALSGGSRSNYQSEEADLTDAMISNVEKIDIPNTNQFYENLKFVEKVKEQGNLINTMKQIASTFEAGARFKTAFDAMQAKNDSIAGVTGEKGKTASGTNISDIAKAATIDNAEVAKENTEINETNVELEKEKNQTNDPTHQNSINELQFNMLEVREGLNMRQIGNEIDGSIQALYSAHSASTGIDKITTTGEAQEFLGVNGLTGKIIDAIFFEYAEKGIDITNPRIQRRILAKHAKTLESSEKATLTTWSTNLRAKVRTGLEAEHTAGVYEKTGQGDANGVWGDGGLVDQGNAIKFGGASKAASSIDVAETIAKGIRGGVVIGTEGLTISQNNIDDLFSEQPVTINGKEYDSYDAIPDNVISASVKARTKNIVTAAMREKTKELADDAEQEYDNFNKSFITTNVDEKLRNPNLTTEQRKLFFSAENGSNLVIQYANLIQSPQNQHLARYNSNGLVIPEELLSIFAKSDTGSTDTNVETTEKYASTFNDIEENLIKSSVKDYKYGEGADKELIGSDLITVERARNALNSKFLSRLDQLETLVENRPVGTSAKSVELDFIQGIFEKEILPNINKGVYDESGSTGVTKELIFNKGVLLEQFEANPDLQNSPVPVGLAEKNNFERAKAYFDSGRSVNKDVLTFYDDVKMNKVLNDGTKVPMTNLEKLVHRSKAIGALSDKDGDGILEYDDTRKYFTMKDLAVLRKQPTDGKYLQITAEVLPDFKEALLAMKPSASSDFNTFEANFPTTGRDNPRKDNLQGLNLEQIQALVLTNDMNKIGYFELDGERLYNTINELTSKGMMKKGQKFDQNAQFYVRMYMLQKNINQRKRSISGLTVIPYAQGQQPTTMGIGGKGTDGGTTTLGNTQDDSDWLGIPNFSYNDLQIMRRVFPLMESHPMSSFATMTKGVSQLFLDAPDKKKFFEKDRYLQHDISRRAILDSLIAKPRTVNPRDRKRN
tara:strand:- start:2856 stop:5753 length:2898 start_codon:yes stop_codon:yes gene_type:complete